MTKHKQTGWKVFTTNIRNNLFAGVLILMPFGITLLVMRWLFDWMAGFLKPWLLKLLAHVINDPTFQTNPPAYVSIATSILSILILFLLVYLVGTMAHKYFGKKLIHIGEWALMRIPVLRTIYSATKQVMSTLSLPSRDAFLSVVLVDFPRPGLKAIGFLTGYIEDTNGKKYCKVFIPTTPNPTTGFFEFVPAEEIVQTTLTVEDAFKMLMSGGIVSPQTLEFKPIDKP
ncbi:MAG: hypothetical protein A2Y12_15835 [Planctomycetes bacterium GWF2_42_9]|nr:MAG: hypothetical protein A2Y12_15835 [Planctomycetes bacterium GWF2_42_9]HAL44457.1 hypothetical protein [Phycisphaerales bacterium]